MKSLLAFVACLLIVATLFWPQSNRRAKRLKDVFQGRRALNDEEFYLQHFAAMHVRKKIPTMVRKVLSQELDADLSRLAPSDSLAGNLSFLLDFDSMADVAIVESLEEEFGIRISDDEASMMQTVEDIVLGVASKLCRSESGNGSVADSTRCVVTSCTP